MSFWTDIFGQSLLIFVDLTVVLLDSLMRCDRIQTIVFSIEIPFLFLVLKFLYTFFITLSENSFGVKGLVILIISALLLNLVSRLFVSLNKVSKLKIATWI